MRRSLIVAVLVSLVGFGLHIPASAAGPPLVGVLKPEGHVFWQGAEVGSTTDRATAMTTAAEQSCQGPPPCFAYSLKLAQKAARLRVGIDVPSRRDMYRLTVTDPNGAATQVQNFNAFDAELFVDKPIAGTWSVVVTPVDAEHSTFRLRAKLERTPYAPSKSLKLWAPDLMVPRLWEFTFVAPVTGFAGVSFDDANPPVDAAGIHPFSCTFDEMAEGAHRCLRFSFQLANAGPGNFDVRFNSHENPQEGKMVQCVERPGKAPLAHEAGEYWFHAVHGHYHYQNVVEHQLFRVTDRRTGAMTRAGRGEKVGYHPADQSFAQWDRFVQGPSGTSDSAGNCYEGSTDQIGLSRGWGDAYRWQRPGNFVEFGTNPDGWYVIRTVADPLNHVLEANKHNNVGYAYVRVLGNSVQLLETGQGMDPWDPHKVVHRYSP